MTLLLGWDFLANSSLPAGTGILRKGRGQISKKFMQELRSFLIQFLEFLVHDSEMLINRAAFHLLPSTFWTRQWTSA